MAWLARAARLAPGDPRIALDLARLRLGGGAEEVALAAAEFARLAARHDVSLAWVGLAMARLAQGDAPGAAAAMDALLARHVVPEEPRFTALLRHIAQASGRAVGVERDVAALNRVEGLVAVDAAGLHGWASRPAVPEAPPALILQELHGPALSGKIRQAAATGR